MIHANGWFIMRMKSKAALRVGMLALLMLVSAFAGRDFILKAYHEAMKLHYRFYSFGDVMLIL